MARSWPPTPLHPIERVDLWSKGAWIIFYFACKMRTRFVFLFIVCEVFCTQPQRHSAWNTKEVSNPAITTNCHWQKIIKLTHLYLACLRVPTSKMKPANLQRMNRKVPRAGMDGNIALVGGAALDSKWEVNLTDRFSSCQKDLIPFSGHTRVISALPNCRKLCMESRS